MILQRQGTVDFEKFSQANIIYDILKLFWQSIRIIQKYSTKEYVFLSVQFLYFTPFQYSKKYEQMSKMSRNF